MANDLNQCNFIGRLGKDPDARFMPSGEAVSNFNIACDWKGKDSEGVEWVRISAFGKLAEICNEYLKKGSQVFISGKFKTRKFTDKDGQERYSTEIVADRMQMLGGKQDDQPKPQPNKGGKGGFDDMDDDVPL